MKKIGIALLLLIYLPLQSIGSNQGKVFISNESTNTIEIVELKRVIPPKGDESSGIKYFFVITETYPVSIISGVVKKIELSYGTYNIKITNAESSLSSLFYVKKNKVSLVIKNKYNSNSIQLFILDI